MAGTFHFQWQNETLCKTIYPMRLQKLRDFLVFYKEVDLWAEYKNKNISTLAADVKAYEDGLEFARLSEFKRYSFLKSYFMTASVRGKFIQYKPLDEANWQKWKRCTSFSSPPGPRIFAASVVSSKCASTRGRITSSC
jgi:hypothetical protein